MVIIAILFASITSATAQPTGAVFATDSTGNPDANLYPTTAIYISGHHLTADTPFIWKIYDKGTKTGGDPPGCTVISEKVGCAIELAGGSGGKTTLDGLISPPYPTGWSIPNGIDDGHKYKLWVKFGPIPEDEEEDDFYIKIDSFAPVPEASTMILTTMGIFGIFLASRKYRQK